MTKLRRGLNAMDPEHARRIQSQGGKAAHAGIEKCHEWTQDEAKRNGRLGGLTRAANRRARLAQQQQESQS